MRREIHRRQDLKYRQHQLDGQGIEVPDAGVVGGEAPEGQRRKSVAHGIEPIHAGESQGNDARRREPRVHRPQQFGGLPDARRQFAVLHGAGHFGAIDLHPAHAEHGQDGHGEHDDAHAAEPGEEMPP